MQQDNGVTLADFDVGHRQSVDVDSPLFHSALPQVAPRRCLRQAYAPASDGAKGLQTQRHWADSNGMSPRRGWKPPRRLAVWVGALGFLAGACSSATAAPTIPPEDLTPIEPIVAEPIVVEVPHVAVTLVVVDETGSPVPGATLEVAGRSIPADARGHAEMSLNQPVLAIVAAPGYLPAT